MPIKMSDTQFIEEMLTLPIFKGMPAALFNRFLDHHKKQWENEPKQYIAEPFDEREIEQVSELWHKHFPEKQWPK